MSDHGDLWPRPLGPQHIDRAYSLVREIAGPLSLEDWRRYARHFAAAHPGQYPAPAGMVVIEDEAERIRALFAYCLLPSLTYGGMLALDCLVVPEMVYRRRAAESLLKGAEACARHFDCHMLSARLERSNAWLGGLLREFGFREEGLGLRRPLLRLANATSA